MPSVGVPPPAQASLGKLLDTAEWLGCCSAAPAVDCYLNRLLLLEAHADLAGAPPPLALAAAPAQKESVGGSQNTLC